MINTNLLSKTLLAILALIIGASFGLYVWNQNTQPVIAGGHKIQQLQTSDSGVPKVNTQQNIIIEDQTEESNNNEEEQVSELEPVIDLKVEMYRSSSNEGPWIEADTPAGAMLIKGDWVYWKVLIENTGEVALTLEYNYLIDGVEKDLKELLGSSLPSLIEVGENIEFIHKSHVYSGIHWNEIQVTGSYNPEITVTDRACYQGMEPLKNHNEQNDQPPSFVVPEYPLGALSGLLVLLAAYMVVYSRR